MKPGEFVTSESTRQWGRTVKADVPEGLFRVEWADGSTTVEETSGKGRNWHPCMPRAVAEQMLGMVRQFLAEQYGEGWNPKLYEPGHEGNYWNISLEGPGDWPYQFTCEESEKWPAGVYAEADTSWCLALYWSR
jgi:hypothetical protein